MNSKFITLFHAFKGSILTTIYVEKEIELSRLIESCSICEKNQTGQQRDRSYKFGLC